MPVALSTPVHSGTPCENLALISSPTGWRRSGHLSTTTTDATIASLGAAVPLLSQGDSEGRRNPLAGTAVGIPPKRPLAQSLREVPTQVDLDLGNLVALEGEHFRVPEPGTILACGVVGDDNLIARLDDPGEVKRPPASGSRPASLEVAGPIEVGVRRRVEAQAGGEEYLDPFAVAGGECLEYVTCQVGSVGSRHRILR